MELEKEEEEIYNELTTRMQTEEKQIMFPRSRSVPFETWNGSAINYCHLNKIVHRYAAITLATSNLRTSSSTPRMTTHPSRSLISEPHANSMPPRRCASVLALLTTSPPRCSPRKDITRNAISGAVESSCIFSSVVTRPSTATMTIRSSALSTLANSHSVVVRLI